MFPKQKQNIVLTEKGEMLFSEKCFHVFLPYVGTLVILSTIPAA